MKRRQAHKQPVLDGLQRPHRFTHGAWRVCCVLFLCACSVFTASAWAQARFDTAQAYYEDASKRASAGELDAASIQLRNALKIDDAHLPSLVLLGEIHSEQGDVVGATQRLSEALLQGAAPARIVPTLIDAYLSLGAYATLLRDLPEEAVPNALRAEILAGRAQAYTSLNKLAEASVSLRKAETRDPDNVRVRLAKVVLSIRQQQRQIALGISETLVRDKPDDARAWAVRAAALEAMGQLDPAIAAYERSLELRPNEHDARVALIGDLISLGRLEVASGHVEYLRETTPFDARGAYFEALIASLTGDLEKERNALSLTAQIIDAMEPQALASRPQLQMVGALANFGLGAFERAKVLVEEYLQIRADDQGAERLFATILLELGEEKLATQRLLIMQRRNPGDGTVRALLASAYTQAGQHHRAAELLSGIEGAGEGGLQTDAQLGFSLLNAGRLERGLQTLEAVRTQQSTSSALDLPLAAAYVRTGRWEKALQLLDNLLLEQPDNPNYRNLRALALLESGDVNSAREEFRALIAQDPLFLAARINLIKLATQSEDWDAAQALLDGAPDDKQESAGILKERARLALAKGDNEEALRHAERSVQVAEDDLEASQLLVRTHLRLGNADLAENAARKATSGSINDLAANALLGQTLIATGQPKQALLVYTQMSRLADFDPVSLHRIATLQAEAGDYDAALYSLSKALQGDALYLPARRTHLLLLMSAGAYEDAHTAALYFSADYPGDAMGPLITGDALLARGLPREALDAYVAAAALGANAPAALGRYRGYSALGNETAAEKALRDYFEEFGEDLRLEAALSDLLLRQERWEEAQTALNRLLERSPDYPAHWNNRAFVRHQLGDSGAIADAERAQELAPESPLINDTLGWLLALAGRSSDALPYLREAVARSDKDLRYRYHLSKALADLGRDREALHELYYALEPERAFDERGDALALRDTLERDLSP
ncbi:MAG: putative PEP-CTERM system TPR-repeat lipoprotein [Halieaceae bacterium]